MHTNRLNLMKILIADEKARDTLDQMQTDRDGELLPDPSDEPTETAARRLRNARLAALLKHREEQD